MMGPKYARQKYWNIYPVGFVQMVEALELLCKITEIYWY